MSQVDKDAKDRKLEVGTGGRELERSSWKRGSSEGLGKGPKWGPGRRWGSAQSKGILGTLGRRGLSPGGWRVERSPGRPRSWERAL